MSAHTPGPWKPYFYVSNARHGTGTWGLIGPNGSSPVPIKESKRADCVANIKLMAAAPDLLAACEVAESALEMFASSTCCDGDDDGVSHESKCKVGQALVTLVAAVAKARGGK